jgi:hypothetical protein
MDAGQRRPRRGLARAQVAVALLALAWGCNGGGTPSGTLVGTYAVQGVLVENSCGQSGLPAAATLKFSVEIREDGGVGYWVQGKQGKNSGSLNAQGEFRFSVADTQVLSTMQPVQQPSDFTTLQPDFDLQPKRTCAVTTRQTLSGSLRRRQAADGGAVVALAASDAAVSSDTDLSAEQLIEVTPTVGSDCNTALAALGGNYLALPCDARYLLTGTLQVAPNTHVAGAAAVP